MGKKAQEKKEKRGREEKREKGEKVFRQRPKTEEEFARTMKVRTSDIKNKQKRLQVREQRRVLLKNIKSKARKQRKDLPADQKQMPKTIEDKQEATDAHLI